LKSLAHVRSKNVILDELPRYETLIHMLAASVAASPEQPAIICEHQRISYRQLGRAVTGLVTRLRRSDLAAGRVVMMVPNSIEAVVATFAAMTAGAQIAPVNPFYTDRELEPIISGITPDALITTPSMEEKAARIAERFAIEALVVISKEQQTLDDWIAAGTDFDNKHFPAPEDFALMVHTGGTTGTPKGVQHTHAGLAYSVLQHCTMWPIEFGEERFLNCAPIFHIWGMGYATLVPIYARGTFVIVPKYDPDAVLNALAEHRITVFGGGPAPIYAGLLGNPLIDKLNFSSLKFSLSGGAPCPAELHRNWREVIGTPLLEGWGMSEGAPLCLSPADGERKLLSVGNPVPDTEIQVVDLESGNRVLPLNEPGEIRVRGPQLMRGYYNKPEETKNAIRDGWLYTGDIGYADEDGFIFLVDRKKDMVIVGGYNVYPREVDELLFNHSKIREAAAVGKHDDRLGEVIVAFVVLEAGARMDEEEFFAYCKENLVKYKRPVEVTFIDGLPRTAANKIDKLTLRRLAESV
jgi:long-chain acyl-CoA synthetase